MHWEEHITYGSCQKKYLSELRIFLKQPSFTIQKGQYCLKKIEELFQIKGRRIQKHEN